MHTCALHQFHDTRQKHTFPVTDGIDLDFFSHQVTVNQNRSGFIQFDCILQVLRQHPCIGNDFHRPAAEDKGRPHQHRISDFLCSLEAGLQRGHGNPFGMRDGEPLQQRFKRIPVFRRKNSVRSGADDRDSFFRKRPGKIDGRLSAQ